MTTVLWVNCEHSGRRSPDYYVNPRIGRRRLTCASVFKSVLPMLPRIRGGDTLNNMVTFTIIIAGINVGVQTYPEMASSVILFGWIGSSWASTVEIIVKIIRGATAMDVPGGEVMEME